MKRQQKIFLFSFLSVLFLGSFLFLSFAFAQGDPFGLQPVGDQIGLGGQDIRLTIAKIIRALLGLLGIIAVGIMLYGGFVYMTAGGNEEKIGTAKKILTNGVIGLVIILSSFSIAQFIINELGKATGALPDNVPVKCEIDSYAEANTCECYNFDCGGNESCKTGLEEKDYFVVKSISPVTSNTHMNNVVIRAIFNKNISDKFSRNEVFDIKQDGKSVSSSFSFEFITETQFLQATYIGEEFCIDEETNEKIPCLDFGDYTVEVRGDLESEDGVVIAEETDCGIFPLEAEFVVGPSDETKKIDVLDFNGRNGFISTGSSLISEGAITLETWIKPREQKNQYLINASGQRYYLRLLDDGRIHFRLGTPDEGDPGSFKLCQLYSPLEKSVSLDDWHHIVAVSDPGLETENLKIYLDGQLVAISEDDSESVCSDFEIGSLFLGFSSSVAENVVYNGYLGSTCVYNSALDLEYVSSHYDLGVGSCGQKGDEYEPVIGWNFDEGKGDVVNDYVDGKQSPLSDGVSWKNIELTSDDPFNFVVKKTIDNEAPKFKKTPELLDGFGLLGVGADNVLKSGKAYLASSQITDSSGLGFYRVQLKTKVLGEEEEISVDYFDGPRVKKGSDAPPEKPFEFLYPIFTSFNPVRKTTYTLILDATDIDSNFSQITKEYVLVPDVCLDDDPDNDDKACGGGPGDTCTEDLQCANGNKCVDKKCTVWPKIVEVDPMHGATGNWVSILGKNFGEEEGSVKFATDNDDDGELSDAEWDDALIINVVNTLECGDTWRDNYIIIEVPNDDILAQGTKSAIRVSISDDDETADTTIDDYGKKLGLFEKDDEQLPGLCSVKTVVDPGIEGATAAFPETPIVITGGALGVGNVSKVLNFDEYDAPYDSWSETKIFADVPDKNLFGETAVSVKVDDKKSNKIKFEILETGGLDPHPTIEKIDPISTTPGSYITISGSGFGGEEGEIYISNSSAAAEGCAESSTLSDDCVELDLLGFPDECSNIWKKNEVIAKLPLDTLPGDYFLALRNGLGYYTSGVGVDGIVGEQPLELLEGEPNPGICKIKPNSGVAPRIGDPIKIYGDNFVSPDDTSEVYFWVNSASSTDMSTWMNTGENVYPVDNIQGQITSQKIETFIPYINKEGSSADGTTMESGPIKVGVGDRFSNGVDYTISDCRNANDAEKLLMQGDDGDDNDDGAGYQCCEAVGLPDEGKWKSNEFACLGESRDAGYVWRFSTGEINSRPRVLEQCDVENWNEENGFDVGYPSPTPSNLWTSGESACLNATIGVKFNINIDQATTNPDTIKVYNCGTGETPVCGIDSIIPSDKFYWQGASTLEIRTIPPAQNFDPNTWYQVELSSNIMSLPKVKAEDVLGQLGGEKYNLEVTSECLDDDEVDGCVGFEGAQTAYFFNFKTADFNCQMKAAIIEPDTYTTNYLGRLYSPDGVPPNPLYYAVKGISDKVCTIISADAYTWGWTADEDLIDIEITPPDYNPGGTSRVSPVALDETPAVKVEATAIVDVNANINVLLEIENIGGLSVTDVEDVVVLDDFVGENFADLDDYKVSIEYELNDITTTTMTWNNHGGFWESYRFLYAQKDTVYLAVKEVQYPDGKKERLFDSNLWDDPDMRLLRIYDLENLDRWTKGSYVIEKTIVGDFNIYDINSDESLEAITDIDLLPSGGDYSQKNTFGAIMLDGNLENILDGKISLFNIEKSGDGDQVITATNTTTISVSPPSVIEYGPNCAEACVNSSFWVRFDRPMTISTYNNNIELYKCPNEQCIVTDENKEEITVSDTSDILVLSANLNEGVLVTSTWYQVVVKGVDKNEEGGVRAIGNAQENIIGKPMEEDFVWKFRTKSDPSPCAVDNVRINPDPFVAQIIGEQTKYSAIPRSQSDKCSSVGQELNPWSYGWSWQTGDEKEGKDEDKWVASVTDFKFGSKFNNNCNLGCVSKGSDYSTSAKNLYLCGNGVVDPGEDCDIADPFEGEIIGTSCTLDCLRPGNSDPTTCGDGEPDTSKGEECDPGGDKKDWKYCTQNCLNVGSSQESSSNTSTPWCKSGQVTNGEDCDLDLSLKNTKEDKENQSSIGCSESCLHLGTPLEQYWCDYNPNYADECGQAVSWCGNGIVESGEECETITGGVKYINGGSFSTSTPDYYCDSKCLLRNICEIEINNDGLRCDPETEGCNNDCTLAGSSVSYKEASLCGDGIVGVGESGFCEADNLDIDQSKVTGNPVQRVYAKGLGIVSTTTVNKKEILAQYTTIEATVMSYFSIDENGETVINNLDDDAQAKGVGDYYIACGYEEYTNPSGVSAGNCTSSNTLCMDDSDCKNYIVPGFEQPIKIFDNNGVCWNTDTDLSYLNEKGNPQTCVNDGDCSNFGGVAICQKDVSEYKQTCENNVTEEDIGEYVYNVCPYNSNSQDFRTFGVADNSCCYERPYKVDNYPVDGKGLTGDKPVCPNTLLEFDFKKEIDKNSIENNFKIAVGHMDPSYDCVQDGAKDVTLQIQSTITAVVSQADNSGGFFQKVWNFVKRFLAGVFGTEAQATKTQLSKITVWCAGNISATSEVLNHIDVDDNLVTSTVRLYLNDILPKNSYIAVYLEGGNDGITDVSGVGIKNNPDDNYSMLQDSIVFMTGAEVCKIEDVEIYPAHYLFDKPNTTHEFRAITKTKNDEEIVNIPGVYDWELEWQPQNNEIVNIPAPSFSATSTVTTFGVGNLQGSLIAVANIKITEDKDTESGEGSQKGFVFTGLSSIEVNFCESPWPSRIDGSNEWLPFEDDIYNFRFSYCADAGLSGEELDDLPYLDGPLEFVDVSDIALPEPIIGNCLYNNDQCESDFDCEGELVSVPGLDSPLKLVEDKGICWDDNNGNDKIHLETEGDLTSFSYCLTNDNCLDYTEGDISLCKKDFEVVDNHCQLPEVEGEDEELPVAILSKDTLLRYVLVNNKNDDVIGVQIFKNSRDEWVEDGVVQYAYTAKPINEWYSDRFDNLSGMQPIQLAGYQGLTDGRNYYVNALNETNDKKGDPSGKIYSNVYLFSVNKGAQQGTLQVFEKILNSLEFNINISDHGKCLSEDSEGNTDSFTSDDCSTDFDCRDFSSGVSSEGTNGTCSNNKTKLFRDWARLKNIATLQDRMESAESPALQAGTFLPSYTVSRWPSWGEFGFGIQDEINSWVGCDTNENTDSQTCWDAVSSTYHCPTFSSVYEYKYNENLKDYILHAPLEYFAEDSEIVDYFVDLDHFRAQPWCQADLIHTPFGEKCGDGIVNPGEQCEPIGKKVVSDWGVVSEKEEDGCDFSYKNETWDNSCAVDADCGNTGTLGDNSFYVKKEGGGDTIKLCSLSFDDPSQILKDVGWEESSDYDGRNYYFGCSEKDDCLNADFYNDRAFKEPVRDWSRIGASIQNSVWEDELVQWLTDNEDSIDCVHLANFIKQAPISEEDVNCSFKGDLKYGSCKLEKGVGYTAYASCDDSCQWEYSSCGTTYYCGNGIVEVCEVCDDGALNGTYGHCADEDSTDENDDLIGACQGLHGQFCGNEKRDFIDQNGNGDYDDGQDAYLELCDFSDDVGYCYKFPNKPCIDNTDCFDNSAGPGTCVMKENAGYAPQKQNTCSWDCQDYGAYCGDGIKQVTEDCDDGNNIEQDGCNNKCLKENLACKEQDLYFEINQQTGSTELYIAGGECDQSAGPISPSETISECAVETNGTEICRAYGLACSNVAGCANPGTGYEFVGLGSDPNGSCEMDLSWLENEKGPYKVICSGVYDGPQPEQPTPLGEKYCGNGVADGTYEDKGSGKEVTEACDLGDQNGKACSPEYNDSCTYCSNDCQEILTIDSPAYCGNGKIDFTDEYFDDGTTPIFESCEKVFGGGFISALKDYFGIEVTQEEFKVCADKGNYQCLNSCKLLQNNCVDCGFSNDGKLAKVNLLNVLNGGKIDHIGWPLLGNTAFNFIYIDDLSNFGALMPQQPISLQTNPFLTLVGKINTNPMCNAPGKNYKIQFGTYDEDDQSRMFDFPVNNEPVEVVNNYAISPTVPPGTFRAVIRWTDKDSDVEFSSEIFSEELNPSIDITTLNYPNFINNLCSDTGYLSCYSQFGIYVHERASLEDMYVQAMTIDTKKQFDPRKSNVYAFTVRQTNKEYLGKIPMGIYADSDIIVEVYENIPEQDDDLSLYKPQHTFKIKTADKGGGTLNKTAIYWHVFNLVFNDVTNKYEVIPVETFETNKPGMIDAINNLP